MQELYFYHIDNTLYIIAIVEPKLFYYLVFTQISMEYQKHRFTKQTLDYTKYSNKYLNKAFLFL